MKRLYALACALFGYEVVVVWDKKLHVHHALTREDAAEWVRCYQTTSGARARVWAGLFQKSF